MRQDSISEGVTRAADEGVMDIMLCLKKKRM